MNGSPLFTGDAGSGESEIRRWILENDWLEAIVALPEQLFYNTGIGTYVWILSNRKAKKRQGKVQLINSTGFWVPMRRSLGDKRREIAPEQIQQITEIFETMAEGENSKIYPNEFFGYRRITVERPLRLNFQTTPERIGRLKEERAFKALAESKKKNPKEKAVEEASGRQIQEKILAALATLPDTLFKNREDFTSEIDKALKRTALKLGAPIRKAILSALSVRDENAEACRDEEGNPEPDPDLRDTENVKLSESIDAFFDREVRPHVPDAWINTAIRDHKEGESAESATRSTSTAISTDISRHGRWRRSRRTLGLSRPKS